MVPMRRSGVQRLTRFLDDESGATAIEYCFIAGLVSVAITAGLTQVGGKLLTFFTNISTHLN